MKFHVGDFNGSETAYAFDAVRGTPGAADDTVGNRQEFLLDVAGLPATPATPSTATG